MKVVIAIDSFKGSISTVDAASAAKKGVQKVFPEAEVVMVPIADGGEDTVSALVLGTGGKKVQTEVVGPLGEKRTAEFGIIQGNTAVIEMASASGLPLVPENKRNPLVTTSYGTGQLIRKVIRRECKKIILGVGGSATNDGGMGMAQALGISFKDADGKELGYGGGELSRLSKIDSSGIDPQLKECEFIIACDVTNPLCGETGASAIYGPQKGATPKMIKVLDNNLAHLAKVIKNDCGLMVADQKGSGAAGGLPVPLIAYSNISLISGIEIVLDILGFDQLLKGADLVLTGEGRIDAQSVFGKVPVGVAKAAKKHGLPVIAIVGGMGKEAEAVYNHGVDSIFSIVDKPMCLEDSMEDAYSLIIGATERAMRGVAIGMKMN